MDHSLFGWLVQLTHWQAVDRFDPLKVNS